MWKKITAILLTFLLIFNSIMLEISAAPKKTSKKQTENIEISLDFKKIADILDHINNFSDATKREKIKICKYYSINEDMLIKLEEDGFLLSESINLALMNSEYGFQIDEIDTLYELEDDLKELNSQLWKYNFFVKKENITEKFENKLRKLLLKGYKADEIQPAYIVSEAIGIDIDDIIAKESNNNEKTNNIDGVENTKFFKENNNINMDKLLEYLHDRDMSLEDADIKINEYQINKLKSDEEELLQNGLDDIESTGDELLNYNKEINAPFYLQQNCNESVSLVTGGLSHEYSLFSIPGRNGMDLNISIKYNSDKANLYEMNYNPITINPDETGYEYDVYYRIDGYYEIESATYRYYRCPELDRRETLVDTYSTRSEAIDVAARYRKRENVLEEDGRIYYKIYSSNIHRRYVGGGTIIDTGEPSNTYLELQNNLGPGWSFNFSSIECDEENENYTLHLGDGQSYEIDWDDDSGTNLKDYELKDMHIEEYIDERTNWEIASKYMLVYKDGRKEYFADDGRLLYMEDRYGNSIIFKHTMINKHPVVTKIIDTLNRETNILYDTMDENTQNVSVFRGSRSYELILEKTPVNETEYVITEIIDPESRETSFEYEFEEGFYNPYQKKDCGRHNIYANLLNITYPTGASSKYSYERSTGNLGYWGLYEYFRIYSREDMDKGISYNKQIYNYAGNFTGYPTYRDPNKLPSLFTYSTTVWNDDDLQKIYKFNNKHLKIEEKIQEYDNNLLRLVTYKYDVNKLPKEQTTTFYGATGYERDIQVTSLYNDFGDRLEYTDESGVKTNCEYDEKFHLVTSETKSFASEIIQRTEYTVDSNGNMKTKKQIHMVGGNDKSILTSYTHDSYGNVLSEKTTKEDGTIVEKKYEYGSLNKRSPMYKIGYLTREYTVVKDFNGVSNTLEQNYEYDRYFGIRTAYIDGKVNKTSTTYDKIGRIIKVTNPDDTFVTITYNDVANTVEIIDENNHKKRNVYDGLGRIIRNEEMKDGDWITLSEKHYNFLSQLDWERDANGNTTSYEYDILGKAIKIINSDDTYKTTSYDDGQNMKIDYNEEGEAHYYYYDNLGKVIKETVEASETNETYETLYTYGKCGQLTTYIDANGNMTEYIYDDLSRLISVINAKGEATNYEYDEFGNITKIITSGGSISRKYYDEANRIIKEVDPLNNIEYTKYDNNGNVVKKIDKNGQETVFSYDNRNRLISMVNEDTDTIRTYDNCENVLSISEDEETTSYEYYENGKLKRVTQPDGRNIYYEYDNSGNRIGTKDHAGGITEYTYDSMNRLNTVEFNNKVTEYEYYPEGSRKSITYPGGTNEKYTYDSLNNLTRLTNLSPMGEIISRFSYTYDKVGNQLTKTDKNGTTEYFYDELNRVEKVIEPNGTSSQYDYDNNSNILRKSINNRVSEVEYELSIYDYIYDQSNRLTEQRLNKQRTVQEPVLNTLTITPGNVSVAAGEPITFTLAGIMSDGTQASDEILNTAVWTSDSENIILNMSTGKVITGVIPADRWNMMGSDEVITVRVEIGNISDRSVVSKEEVIQEPILNILTVTPGNVSVEAGEEITFTLTGTMSNGTQASDEILNTAVWTSDSENIILNMSTGKGITGVIPADRWNIMGSDETITVRAEVQGKITESRVSKQIDSTILGSIVITPSSVTLDINSIATLTISGVMQDGTPAPDSILNLAGWRIYNQDPAETDESVVLINITGKTVRVTNQSGVYYSRIVDSINETANLNKETIGIDSIIPLYITKIVEAKIGNVTCSAIVLTSRTGIKPPLQGDYFTTQKSELNEELPNNNPTISTEEEITYFEYDNNGNLTEQRTVGSSDEKIFTYDYNKLNQLINYTNSQGITESYSYDASGLRNSKTTDENTTNYYYDGQNVIIEMENGGFSARNIWGINPIARMNDIDTLYYLYNGHADVVELVDDNGNVLNSYDYDIYGKIKEENESGIENPIRYAGQYYDSESKMYYLRARYYDPGLMRFITEDTNKGDVKDPLSLNLYTYCIGNPIELVDIDGHSPQFIRKAQETLFGICLYVTTWFSSRQTYYANKLGDKIASIFKIGSSKSGQQIASSLGRTVNSVEDIIAGYKGDVTHIIEGSKTGTQAGHAWEVFFNGSKPSFSQIEPYIAKAIENGVETKPELLLNGAEIVYKYIEIDGYEVWVKLIIQNGVKKLSNAGVNNY